MDRLCLILLTFVLFGTLYPFNFLLSDQGTDVINVSSGDPISGDLTVEVWDSPTGGNLLYSETFTDAIVNGSWNVMLGSDPTNPLELEYGKVYYKDYKINGEDVDFTDSYGHTTERLAFNSPLGDINGTYILPRSVSGTSIKEGSLTDTEISDNTNLTLSKRLSFGLNGYIENLVSNWLTVGPNVNVSGAFLVGGEPVCLENGTGCPPGVSPSGPDGAVQYNSGGNFAGSSDLVWDDTHSRLGIGTYTPQARLHVKGGEVWIFNDGANPRIVLGDNGGAGQYGYLGWDSANDYYRIETDGTNGLKIKGNHVSIGNVYPGNPLTVANGTEPLLVVKDDGKIGIGTNNPQTNLHITSSSDVELRIEDITADHREKLSFWDNDEERASITADSGYSETFIFNTSLPYRIISNIYPGSGTPAFSFKATRVSGSDVLMSISNNSTTLMTMTGTGRVGLGTSPQDKLTVRGDVRVSDGSLRVGYDPTMIDNSVPVIGIANDGDDSFFVTNSGDMSEGLVMRGGENVAGIIYNVYSNEFTNGWHPETLYIFNNHTNSDIRVRTTTGDVAVVKQDGRVGVNTTDVSSSALTVNGEGNFTGAVLRGGYLMVHVTNSVEVGSTAKTLNFNGVDVIDDRYYERPDTQTVRFKTGGLYRVSYTVNWMQGNDDNGRSVMGAVLLLNGNPLDNSKSFCYMRGKNYAKYGTTTAETLVRADAGDTLKLQVRRVHGNYDPSTIANQCWLIIERIG